MKGSANRSASHAMERSLDSIAVAANLARVPLTDATLYCEDNVPGMPARLEPGSIDLVVTSIPFGALFMYSGKGEDIGNNLDSGGVAGVDMRASAFGLHLRFHIEQLLPVMADGALVCVHIQQLLTTKVQHGYMGRRDFRGTVVDLYSAGGFEWVGETVIPKNPQRVAQAQSIHSLLFITGMRDSRAWAPYVNDYVMFFRKPGKGRVVKALYDADRNPDGWVTREEWIRDAHGVWTDIQETDVLGGYRDAGEEDDEKHVCLARGSLVLTQGGYRPIHNILTGDYVLTHMGRWRRVLAVRNNGIRPVVKLTAQGVPGLRLTPDHKVWTRRVTGSRSREMAKSISPEWVAASRTVGSYVNLRLPPIESASTVDQPVWWAVGRWLADGHIGARGELVLSCGRHETEALVAALGDFAGTIRDTGTSMQIRLRDRGNRLRPIVGRCGRGAEGKHLPPEAFTVRRELADALLQGYLSGDGHYLSDRNRWMASSVSKELLLGVAMLAQRAYGALASIYAGRIGGEAVIQGRRVITKHDWILCFDMPDRSRQKGEPFILDDGAWKRVRSAEPDGESEVWDLEVEEDHSFTAEGCIVHNCPLQLEVIRRCIKLYSAPGDVVLDPFIGIGSTATVAIELGRQAVGFELKESYYQQALRNVRFAREARQHPPTTDLFSVLERPAVESVA